jgi:hypothetical protein
MSVFNSPVELGVRTAFLLLALFPKRADLQRLVFLDYAVIYSGDLNGPTSLHTPVPLRGTEFASRRGIIEDGLYLMATKGIVDVTADASGLLYSAGEQAAAVLGLLHGEYVRDLILRCEWVAATFGDLTDGDLAKIFQQEGLLWGTELLAHEGEGTSA